MNHTFYIFTLKVRISVKNPKYIIVVFFISCAYPCFSQNTQNLVPNPSFEIFDTCPDAVNQISRAVGWKRICTWWIDYYNACSGNPSIGVPTNFIGFQNPFFGNGYAEIGANYTTITARSYFGCKLITPLMPNIQYNAEFHISLAEGSFAACDQVGLLLTKDEVICPDTLYYTLNNYAPQVVSPKDSILMDSINWVTIKGSFVASGGEQYLTMGIFVVNDSINWIFRHPWWSLGSEYYIDDVYVYQANLPTSAFAGNDTIICWGDSLQLGFTDYADDQYLWCNSDGFSDTTARPWVKPQHTTSYILKQNNFKHEISYDTVEVTVKECFEPLTIPNIFTPNGDGKNDKFQIMNPGEYQYSLSIFNRWGSLVFSGDEKHPWDGKQNNNFVTEGVYYYVLKGKNTQYNINYSGVVHLLR